VCVNVLFRNGAGSSEARITSETNEYLAKYGIHQR
jgi:hypothetical protein